MPDPQRAPRRHPNRLNRAHAGQSLDPTLTRKGFLAHPGSLLTAFAAIVFFLYVFNVGNLKTWLDALFGGWDASVKSHNNQVATLVIAALPYLGIGLAVIVAIFVAMSLSSGARTVSKKRKLGGRDRLSLHEFVEAAKQHNIGVKVAREAYHLLLPHYHNDPRIQLSDRMGAQLHMSAIDISDLYGNLLLNTDRMRKVGDDGGQLVTVLDLLTAVEESTGRSLTQSKLHLRRGHADGEAVQVRKRPSLAQRIKESMLRTVTRKAHVPEPPKRDNPSVVRPFRPAVKESELALKREGQGNQSPTVK